MHSHTVGDNDLKPSQGGGEGSKTGRRGVLLPLYILCNDNLSVRYCPLFGLDQAALSCTYSSVWRLA